MTGRHVPGGEEAVRPGAGRGVAEALLTLSSDWAFMVSKNSAVDYARHRARVHIERFDELANLLDAGAVDKTAAVAAKFRAENNPFGQLDARLLAGLPRTAGVPRTPL